MDNFALSKIFWTICSPGNLLALLLLWGGFMAVSPFSGRQEFGRRLCFFMALVIFAVAILPIGDWLLMPLENRFPPAIPDQVDGIVIIGGDENPRISDQRGEPVAYISAMRYLVFAKLARDYPKAQLVFSGGPGVIEPYNRMKDGEVAKQALESIGVPVSRMIFETRSRNTYENAVFSADMVHPSKNQKWLLVTNAWHMPRAIACFRKAGWDIYPMPAGYLSGTEKFPPLQFSLEDDLLKVTFAVHEYYGLLEYWLKGYIKKPWPV